jgi:hypothetical protein
MFIVRVVRNSQIHLVAKIQNVSVVKQLVSIETVLLTQVHKALNIAAFTYQRLLGLMFIPCIIRRIRRDQQYALAVPLLYST